MGSYTRRSVLIALAATVAGCSNQSTGDLADTTDPGQSPTKAPSTDSPTTAEEEPPTEAPTSTDTDDPVAVRDWPEEFYQGPLVSAHEHMHSRNLFSIVRDKPETLVEAMDRNKSAQMMAISSDRYMDQVAEYDHRLVPFAFGWQEERNLEEAAESFADRLDRYPAYDGLGEIGLKAHTTPEGEPPIQADHPEMMDVYELAAERDVPVMIHTEAPWRYPSDMQDNWAEPSEFPGFAALDNAMADNRETDFLIHASYRWNGIPDGQIIAQKLQQHPNLWYDISPTGPKLMYGQGAFTKAEFEAAMGENGVEKEIERLYDQYALILEDYSERVLWGLDAAAEWHFEDWAFDTFIDIGRGILGRLSDANARNVAYRTAENLFDIEVAADWE